MTRFTLYHTVTDTLGRVQGEIYTLDDGLQSQATNEPRKTNTASTERVEMLTEKIKLSHAKRSQQRRNAKGGDAFELESARKTLQNTRDRRLERKIGSK